MDLRGALVSTFRRVVRLYFRDVERVGTAPDANVRGRVFVSNHTNALIDPVLVITGAACEISPVAKSTLWNIPGLSWLLDRAGAVPIIRRKDSADKDPNANAEAFEKIAQHLADGGNILIFPEGTSHSEPKLAPLRSGAARMLEAALAKRGVSPTFQAVALEFDARTEFRSRSLVVWGPVREYAAVAGAGEARIAAATKQMNDDLGELLVEGDTHDQRRRIARVAELIAHDAGDTTLGAWNSVGRQVELASKTLRAAEPGLVAKVAERVDAYYEELDRLRVDDARVALGLLPNEATIGPVGMWLAPLAAAGYALYFLPYWVPRLVARGTDADAVSTIKLGAALVVYPLWMAGLVGASLVLLPPPFSLGAAAIVIVSPFAALRWLDAWYERERPLTRDDRRMLWGLRATARKAIEAARAALPEPR